MALRVGRSIGGVSRGVSAADGGRPHHAIKKGMGDAPIGVLVAPHMVLHVPRQMLFCPGEIHVRPLVRSPVIDRAPGHRGCKKRGNRKERSVNRYEPGQEECLFLLGRAAEDAVDVALIAHIVLTGGAVMVEKVEGEEAPFFLAETVEQMFVRPPLKGIHVD